MNELCNRISDILKYEANEIVYTFKDDLLFANLDCYAISGYSAKALLELARENDRSCVITIQAVDNPHLQIIL